MEGKTAAEPEDLDEATLEGIPSLDFRPVLKLFAPTGDKLQMSPCEECGGTMEVGDGPLVHVCSLRSNHKRDKIHPYSLVGLQCALLMLVIIFIGLIDIRIGQESSQFHF